MRDAGQHLDFVGRVPELRHVRRTIDQLRDGEGSVTVVVGHAGSGKTRFVREAIVACDGPTSFVRCWDDSRPLWPWSKLLVGIGIGIGIGIGDESDPDEGQDAGLDRGSGALSSGFASAGGDRLATFERIAEALINAGPRVVVIDDLHLADTASVLLVRFLARLYPVPPIALIVTTVPPDQLIGESARLMQALIDDAGVCALGRLSDDEATTLISSSGGRSLPAAEVAAIARLTTGSPLAIERALHDVSAPHLAITAATEAAAFGFDDRDKHTLGVAAVFGSYVSRPFLESHGECSSTDVRRAIEAGLRTGLLITDENSAITFGDDVVRAALQLWLTAPDRQSVRISAVEMLVEIGGASLIPASEHAIEAATHDSALASRAIDLLFQSARYERSVGALEEALALAERSVGLAGSLGIRLSPGQQVAHASSALACGRLDLARHLFLDAFAAAEAIGDDDEMANAALGLGGAWLCENRADDEAHTVLAAQRKALDRLSRDDPRLPRLQLRLVAERAYHQQQFDELDDLVGDARLSGDPDRLLEALSLCIHAKLGPQFVDERIELANEMVAIAASAQEELPLLFGQCWLAVSLLLAGDERAPRALRLLERRCATLRCASVQFIADSIAVGELISSGAFKTAEEAANDSFAFGQSVGDPDAWNYYAAHIATIRWLQGRHGELAAFVSDAASSPDLQPHERALAHTAGLFALRNGNRAAGERAVALHRQRPGLDNYQASSWLTAMQALSLLAYELGDQQLGLDIAQQLQPYCGMPVSISLGVMTLGSVDFPHGVALLASGDAAEAVEALGAAARHSAGWGQRPSEAIATAYQAIALHAAGMCEPAQRTMRSAIAIASGFDMSVRTAEWLQMLTAWAAADAVTALVRSSHVRFVRRNESQWSCTFNGVVLTLPDRVGTRHLATLCASPGLEIASTRLAYLAETNEGEQLVIDSHGVAAIRARIDELRSLLDADDEPRSPVEDELDELNEHLLSAAGLGHRWRSFGVAHERARTSVRKAILRTIIDIDRIDPSLAAHLRDTIRTGTSCSYRPG